MQQGDIVIINFPFTSLSNSKVRPALVISNELFNKGKNLILLAISTKKTDNPFFENLTQNDLTEGKILKNSYIRFSNLLSIEKNLILKDRIARLNSQKIKNVIAKLLKFFS